MKILLDTHIFLWYVTGNRFCTKAIRSKILHASEVYVSSASIWEIAIKSNLKKLDANIYELIDAIPGSDFEELPITAQHAVAVSQLPKIHKDPFDRILIAQAISEPLTLITSDLILKEYSELVEVM